MSPNFWSNRRVLVTGGGGFLGGYVVRRLEKLGCAEIRVPRSATHDLRRWENCRQATEGMDIVLHLAAKVGGIGFHRDRPGEMFYDNLAMGVQLFEAARQAAVQKFVALSTACVYPEYAPLPSKESDLWQGYPESITAPYGLAKKAVLVQAQAYRAQYGTNAIYLIPVSLYGPGDNFDPASSHVIASLIRKTVQAKRDGAAEVEVWGTGSATRDFLFVDDVAEGILQAAERYNGEQPANLSSGRETSIQELAQTICEVAGFEGEIRWDTSKPDGVPRRCLDARFAHEAFQFEPRTSLREGLRQTVEWYEANSHLLNAN